MRQGDRVDFDSAFECHDLDRTVEDHRRRTIAGIGVLERASHRCNDAKQ